jgi:hypothetical protein
MSIDAETVGQRERHLSSSTVGDPRRVPEGLFGVVAIEEVTLHIEDTPFGDDRFVDVVGTQVGRDAQIGVHRTLSVGSHDDDASPSRDFVEMRSGREVHTDRVQVVSEHFTELVRTHFSDIGAEPTETRHPTHRVGGRSTAHLDGRSEGSVEMERSVGVDESHRALGQRLTFDEGVVGM